MYLYFHVLARIVTYPAIIFTFIGTVSPFSEQQNEYLFIRISSTHTVYILIYFSAVTLSICVSAKNVY